MFKKKYIPSIKNNNLLRDKVSSELMALIYRLEHGKYDSEADSEAISRMVEELKIGAEALSHSVGTGEENVEPLATKILELIKDLKKRIFLAVKQMMDGVGIIPIDPEVLGCRRQSGKPFHGLIRICDTLRV